MEKDTDGVTGCVRDSLALYIFARCFCSSEMALLKLCLFCATDLTAFKLNGWFVQSKNAVCIILSTMKYVADTTCMRINIYDCFDLYDNIRFYA